LYRSWIGATTARKTERVAIINEVRVSLEELKHMVGADGARLTVLVLPILRPLNDWNAEYRENRRHILDILGSLQLRYFDLLEPLNQRPMVSLVEAATIFWHRVEVAKYFGAFGGRSLRVRMGYEFLGDTKQNPRDVCRQVN
jgi:hypothetical protein